MHNQPESFRTESKPIYGVIEPVQGWSDPTLHWLFTPIDQECDHGLDALCGATPSGREAGDDGDDEFWNTDTDWPQPAASICPECWQAVGQLWPIRSKERD